MLLAFFAKYGTSRIKIITTSSVGWPQHSLQLFAKVGYFGAIHSLLFEEHKVDVVHPKSSCLPFKSSEESIRYKQAAIQWAYYQASPVQNSGEKHRRTRRSIVSIGDGASEYLAVKRARNSMANDVDLVHRIKLSSYPSIAEMAQQADLLSALVTNSGFERDSAMNQELDFNFDLIKSCSSRQAVYGRAQG